MARPVQGDAWPAVSRRLCRVGLIPDAVIRMEKEKQNPFDDNLCLTNLMEARMRFVTLQDPTDNWMVYDVLSEIPAEFAGKVLFGLSREEAEYLTNQANEGFTSKSRPRFFPELTESLGDMPMSPQSTHHRLIDAALADGCDAPRWTTRPWLHSVSSADEIRAHLEGQRSCLTFAVTNIPAVDKRIRP